MATSRMRSLLSTPRRSLSTACLAGVLVLAVDGRAAADEPDPASPPTTKPAAPARQSLPPVLSAEQLQRKVEQLRQRINNSQERMKQFVAIVLRGVIGGSRALVKHRNDVGSPFKLVQATYTIDGATLPFKSETTLDEAREFELFNGTIKPGTHTLTVELVYRGHGYGVFTYMKGYRYTVRGSHTFEMRDGQQLNLTVRAYDSGVVSTKFQDRLAIRFESK